MKTIWKYTIDVENLTCEPSDKCSVGNSIITIDAPIYARPLSVREINGKMVVYFVVNHPSTRSEKIRLHIFGTGQLIDNDGEYVGTVLLPYNGSISGYHVFMDRN